MLRKRTWLGLATIAAVSVGCGSDGSDPGGVGTVAQAIGPCNETVPSNRFIDGLPAYAQCATTQNSAIYSNDGINTATTSMGADWVRTQYSGGYQCTELAHRYLLFRWKVTWLPNGNAGQWCDTQPPANSGVVQTTSPVHGDLMVFAPGSCGADGSTGHVAVVDTVGAKISAVQQNIASRSSYATTCAKCYIHVVANDGSATPGAGGSNGAGGATAAGGQPNGAGGFFAAAGGSPSAGGFATSAGGYVAAGGATPLQGAGGSSLPAAGGAPVPTATGAPTSSAPSNGIPPSGGAGAPTAVSYGGQAGDGTPSGAELPGSNSARMSCAVGPRSNRSVAPLWISLLGLTATAFRRRLSRRWRT